MAALPLILRLLLASIAVAGVSVLWTPVAAAQDDDEDEDDGDEDDGGDDEESEEEDEDEDEDGDDKDKDPQPPVTAGGLFTKKTYPVAENERPLTLIQGMLEVQAGFNIDLSDLEAFETWFGVVKGRYGLADNLELQFGGTFLLAGTEGGAAGPNKARIDIGIEPSIVYDLVDFRFTVEMPIAQAGAENDFQVDFVVGFPFRYKPAKQFAIVALDRLMTIHTCCKKPDLTAGVGFVIQPVDIVAILLRGEITIPDFNTNFILVPATAAVQLSPNNQFDVGLEFTFANIKQPEGSPFGPFDQRFLQLYGVGRF